MKTVLLIDDDQGVLSTYCIALRSAGYTVFTAGNGDEGITLARQKLPDLILTDLHMPGTDGRAVLYAIRQDANLGHKQVVLMTGNPRDVTPRSGMELGADDFLVKPFGLDALLRCVEARLQRAQVNWRIEDRAVSELRAKLHKVLPHEFFTPLAGILGLVEILKEGHAEMTPEEIREILDDVERSGWRLQRTLRNYLLVLEVDRNVRRRDATLAAEIVRGAVEKGAAAAARREGRINDLHVTVESVALRGDNADLTVLVEELVQNACGFSSHSSPVDVRLDARGVLSVNDRGRGMTAEQLSRVKAFQQFDREKFEQQGLGLGLALVQRLTASCGASFSLHSTPGLGTTAQVEFVRTDG